MCTTVINKIKIEDRVESKGCLYPNNDSTAFLRGEKFIKKLN